MTLNDWACNWTFTLLDSVSDPCVQAVFEACAISLKRDLQTLLFFMPYVLCEFLSSHLLCYVKFGKG
jgi:hypothetical protein